MSGRWCHSARTRRCWWRTCAPVRHAGRVTAALQQHGGCHRCVFRAGHTHLRSHALTRHPIHCTLLVGGEIMVRSYSAARDLWQLRVRRGHETGAWGNLVGATGHVDRASECGRSGAGRESGARGAPGPQQTRVRGSRWHARGHDGRHTHEVRACDRQLSVSDASARVSAHEPPVAISPACLSGMYGYVKKKSCYPPLLYVELMRSSLV